MGRMIGTGTDVVGFLKEQHQQVKSMFAKVLSTHGDERAKTFYALRRLLAVHETAEEEIIHPAARRALPDGDIVVTARLREEKEAKAALAQLEDLHVDSLEFETKFRMLQTSVIGHAEAEEQQEFDRLGAEIEPRRLERMRKAAELAESVAPTRPHPGIESQAANLIAGPFASMLDRVRDALSGKV